MTSPHGHIVQDMPLGPVAIFWDYENCSPHHSAGCTVIDNIRQIAHKYGVVKQFKAYLELSEQNSGRSLNLRSELQSCGVSLTDCPHNGRKDVADKMLIVDMLTYAIDTPAPATLILISGDRDFVYAVSILRFRRYHVVVIAPSSAHTSLKQCASELLDWDHDVLGKHRHTRGHSADVPFSRSQWADFDGGVRASAAQTSVGIPNSTVPKSSRRHSFNFRSHTALLGPARPSCLDSDGLPETLHVPPARTGAYSFPPTPHPRTHALKTDAAGSLAREGTAGASRIDSTVLQERLSTAASNATTPISPGTNASGIFSDSEPTTLCENCSGSSSNCELVESPSTSLSVDKEVSSDLVAASTLQSNTDNFVVMRDDSSLPTNAAAARSAPELHIRLATPDVPPAAAPDNSDEFVRSDDTQRRPGSSAPSYSYFSTLACTDPSTSHSYASALASTSTASASYPRPASIDLPVVSLDSMQEVAPFQGLIDILDIARCAGQTTMLRSHVAIQLTKQNERVYQNAGVTKFKEFAALAKQQGIIELGGSEGYAWMFLNPSWHGRGRRLS